MATRELRDRSRSRGKDDKTDGPSKPVNNEQEIVTVAIKQLPSEIRVRFDKLFTSGLLKDGDLDLRSITVFASLNEGLQARVMSHMEAERIYVANARSKSGFLIATCDKAKTGCLDARGLGAIDPWRTALVAMATPKQKIIDLVPERDFLEEKVESDNAVVTITLETAAISSDIGGLQSVRMEFPLTESATAIKAKLSAMGSKRLPPNKMTFWNDNVGYLKDRHSFAYYNFSGNVKLTLGQRQRAGIRFRTDHTLLPKRPTKQPKGYEDDKTGTGGPGAPAAAGVINPNQMKLPASLGIPGLAGAGALGGIPGLAGAGGLLAGMTAPAGGILNSIKLPPMPTTSPALPTTTTLAPFSIGGAKAAPTLPGMTGPGMTGPGMTGVPGMTGPGMTGPGMTGPGMTGPTGMPALMNFASTPPPASAPAPGGMLALPAPAQSMMKAGAPGGPPGGLMGGMGGMGASGALLGKSGFPMA